MKDKELSFYNNGTKTIITEKPSDFVLLDNGEKGTLYRIDKRVLGEKLFWKVYLMDFLAVLGVFDSKQVDVFIYIVENASPSNNLFIGTYSKIENDLHISRPTIAKIFKKLQENDFIKQVQWGVWFINPAIMLNGKPEKKNILLSYYLEKEPVGEITKIKIETNKKKELPEQVPGQLSIDDVQKN